MRDHVVEALGREAERLGGKISYVAEESHGDPEPGPSPGDAGLSPKLAAALEELGYSRLYKFQYESLEAWRRGEDLIIVSGTGTGKTEAFMIPVLEGALRGERSIIIYPTKALARDQVWRLSKIASRAGVRVEVLDGDTPKSVRSRIYAHPPEVLVTNPDMIHYGLAFSHSFRDLVKGVSNVVLDEVHVYRGVFGSHVRWVLYRLERASGGNIRFLMAGATVGNPEVLGEKLTGRRPRVVRGPSRRRGSVVHIMVDAGRASRWSMAAALLAAAERAGLKTLCFVDSQQMAELVARIASKRFGVEAAVHRAGLPAEARKLVEDGFREGRIKAVVATPTLELGVDIGDLDVIVLAHLPRSYSSYLQRAGRAGRRGRKGYVATILADDAIEAYFLKRPSEYLKQEPEPSFLEPGNREVARLHLTALLLESGGAAVDDLPAPLKGVVREVVALGLASSRGRFLRPVWSRARRYVEAQGGIRFTGPLVRIVEAGGREIGWRELPQALYDLHPGAIYYHGGRTYLVERLDLEGLRAEVRRLGDVTFYTKPLYTVDIVSVDPLEERSSGPLKLVYADVKVTVVVEGFVVKEEYTGRTISENPYPKPIAWSYRTKGVLTRYPNPGIPGVEEALSAYHALEHALIHAARPAVGAADTDLGGVSYPSGHIVIYDSAPGGNGASRLVFERFERVEDIAETILASCNCQDGCPRCVYSPYCGNNNKLLSRRRALKVLHARMHMARELKLGYPEGSPVA
ncbi:MAG: DEAD/DEAH box helicase [Desulfurococcales archaeon]|nr:DEAD/DEAH box helicase [Desulfurococcales archaeon]